MKLKRHTGSNATDCSASFVRLFQPRFADLVERGVKTQTVRKTPKRMPAAGDRISLRTWSGSPYRSKQRVLREAEIVEVWPVEIYGDSIHVGQRRLSSVEREAFARADGFRDFADLAEWFRTTHDLPFDGVLIRWQNR